MARECGVKELEVSLAAVEVGCGQASRCVAFPDVQRTRGSTPAYWPLHSLALLLTLNTAARQAWFVSAALRCLPVAHSLASIWSLPPWHASSCLRRSLQIYREGQNERLFDLQTLKRKRIASFEQQASWQRAASAQDLQVRLDSVVVGRRGGGVTVTERLSRHCTAVAVPLPSILILPAISPRQARVIAPTVLQLRFLAGNRSLELPALPGVPCLQRKLQEAAFLRSTDRTDGNARSSRSHAIFVTQARAVWDGVGAHVTGVN